MDLALLFPCRFFLGFNCLKVAAQAANGIIRADLLELLAGSALIAGHVVYGADRQSFPENKMRAHLSGILDNYPHRIFWINDSLG